MIGIADYGLGNVKALLNIYKRLDISASTFNANSSISDLSHIILPGVGSFDWAMHLLNTSGLRDKLDHLVLDIKLPVLGICVGMQIMASRSDEGNQPGLGWIPGDVVRFQNPSPSFTVPHIGWNDVTVNEHAVFNQLCHPSFYFLHSYFFSPSSIDHVIATSHYGSVFPVAVSRDNCIGVQFHPEKSHEFGVQLLKNFSSI